MHKTLEHLAALQVIQFDARPRTTASQAYVEKLRAELPAPILARYERLVARGKKAVASAHGGVCSERHMRVSAGKMANLASATEIHLCDNCGRYFSPPKSEPVVLSNSALKPPEPAKRPSRKAAQRIV